MKDFNKKIIELKNTFQYRKLKCVESSNGAFVVINGEKYLNFGSNNYMNMSDNKKVKEAFIDGIKKWGAGSGASRLVTGSLKIHFDLEQKLASFSRKEASMVFPTGYMANVGLISAIAGKDDLVVLDKTDHASIIDGAKLSGANLRVFPHLNYEYLEGILKKSKAKRKLIVTDSIFSMDGDAADLNLLVALKNKYDGILIVDEAHAVGVFGENGEGLAEERGVLDQIDFKVGTLSKAFGLQGGYVASSHDAVDFLRNKSRAFIYTTAITPGVCSAAIKVIELFEREFASKRRNFKEKFKWFRHNIEKEGFITENSVSQIIPIIIGGNERVLKMEKKLFEAKILVPAIRFPTVKKGTERLRISITLKHTKNDLKLLLNTLKNIS